MERIKWNPRTQTCEVVWANPSVSIPNGIPTMSVASDLVYGIGVRDNVWTLEGVDFGTGKVRLAVPTTALPSSNSVYAAATIGPGRTVWTGTFGGATRFRTCRLGQPCEKLNPFDATVGNLPYDPAAVLPHLIALPNP